MPFSLDISQRYGSLLLYSMQGHYYFGHVEMTVFSPMSRFRPTFVSRGSSFGHFFPASLKATTTMGFRWFCGVWLFLALSSSCSGLSLSPNQKSTAFQNNADSAYPWCFTGRLWFRPSLVRTPSNLPPSVSVVSLLGWTLGGVVALEYDTSPVGEWQRR